jgi:hypothetical protein
VNTPVEPPNSFETGPNLAQVDPPHPFKSALKTIAIAAVLVCLAIGAYVYFGEKPPVASGEILQVNYHPVHTTENGGGGADGMQGAPSTYDQLLILARVRVRNQTNIPLFLQDIRAVVTMPDGTQQMNVAAGKSDVARVFQAFPVLSPLWSQPFDRETTLQPGQTVEGLAIFNYPFTQQQWDSRRNADVVVSFIHQKDLHINFPK